MKTKPQKIFELVLVRHAQSRGNAGIADEGTLASRIDSPLTDDGKRQAALLGKRFSNYPFDIIISSGMERAVETAYLAMKCQPENGATKVNIEPLLTECGIDKSYTGYPISYFYEKFCDVRLFDDVDVNEALVIGNDADDAAFNRERARRFMKKLFDRYENGEKIMAVAHGVFNTELFLELLGISPDNQLLDPDFYNTSVSHFVFYKKGTGPYGFDISLTCLNNIDHLREDFPQLFFENKI